MSATSRVVGPSGDTEAGPTALAIPTNVGSTTIGSASTTTPPRARKATSA